MPHRTRLILGPIILAALAYFTYYYLTAPQFHKMARDMEEARIEFALLGLTLVTIGVIRAMFCDIVWDISANRLVVHTTFFWKRWKQQYTNATLHLETYNDVRGGRSSRLVMRAVEGRHVLVTFRRIWLRGNGNIRAFAAYLSQITGWPVRDESQDRP